MDSLPEINKLKEEDEEQTPTVSEPKREGWETPPQEPINGIVQPRYIPPPGKPTRNTNCLDFIANQVLKPAMKHKHAWPFLKPVDTIKLNIPEYHKVIKKPMDLGTIEKRLKNTYYYSSEECIKDLTTVPTNCFAFNPPEFGIVQMAKDLESIILEKLNKMPEDDFNTLFNNCYLFNQTEDDVYFMCKDVEKFVRERLKKLTLEEYEIDRSQSKKSAKSSVKKPNFGNGPIVRAGSTTSAIGKGSVASSPSNSPVPSESAATVLDFFHKATIQVSRESSIQRSDPASTRAPSVEQKAIKRKADSPPPLVKEEKRRTTTDISRPKRPFDVDFSQMPARYHGKFSKQMNFCQKILKELLTGSRCKDFNWPFLEPVDDEALNIPDYYKIITNPMDLSTMQKKMLARQYASIDEFYTDVLLICENCFKFNPEGQPVNLAGKNLKSYFLARWKDMPQEDTPSLPRQTSIKNDVYAFNTALPPSLPIAQTSYSASYTQHVFGDLNDDEELDALTLHVQNENTRISMRMNEYHKYTGDLMTLKFQRREAMQMGKVPPALKSDLHTAIRNSLLTGLPPNVSSNIPGFNSLLHGRAFTNGINSLPSSSTKANRGRKIGSKNRPKTSHRDDKSEYDFNSDEEQMDEPILERFNDTSAPVPQVGKSSGRGRKPGSKNKPKVSQPNNDMPVYEFNSDDENANEPMTYAEKKELSHSINTVPADKLVKVLEIISKRESGHDKEQNVEEVEIDFETLKPRTLRELEAFANALKAMTQKPNAQKTQNDPTAKKREIEERLAMLDASQPSGRRNASIQPTSSIAPAPQKPGLRRSLERANSSSSSSSESSSSGSSSDSSSDSESENKDQWSRPKVSPKQPLGTNGDDRRRIAHTNNNNIPSSAKPIPNLTRSDERSVQGNVPKKDQSALQSNGGRNIGKSIVDDLLPATEATSSNTISNSMHSTFDNFRRMKQVKEQSQQKLKERDALSSLPAPPSAPDLSQVPITQNDIERRKQLERERRQREAQSNNTCQMEIMNAFEDQF